MQLAHSTLCRLLVKLNDTNALLPVPDTASQQHIDPSAHNPSTAPSDRQPTGPGADCGSTAAPETAEAAAVQLQLSEREPCRSTVQICKSTTIQDVAVTNAADDAGVVVSQCMPRERQVLSQNLLQGWTCGPSQVNCGTLGVQPERGGMAPDAAAAAVPRTPPRDCSTQNAVECPPCIPDTPSESEGVPGSYTAGNGIAQKQVCPFLIPVLRACHVFWVLHFCWDWGAEICLPSLGPCVYPSCG